MPTKKLKINRELKKYQLILFGIGFGLVGALILVYSFALEPSNVSTTSPDTTLEGQIIVTHADPAPNFGSVKKKLQPLPYTVLSTPTKSYKVDLPSTTDSLQVGMHVKLKGKLNQHELQVNKDGINVVGSNLTNTKQPVLADQTQKTTGVIRLLIINADSPYAQVSSIMSTVNSIYSNVSYGKTSFSYTVATVPTSTFPSSSGCFYDYHAAIAAADPTVNFTQFDNVLILAQDHNCFFMGQGGPPSRYTTNDGTVNLPIAIVLDHSAEPNSYPIFIDDVTHELGHNLGEQHARTMTCSTNGPPTMALNSTCLQSCPYGGCTTDEYGDVTSVMGLNQAYPQPPPASDMSVEERDVVGWLNPGNLQQVTQSGNYTISTIEPNNSNLKALWIQRNTCTTERLWIDFHQGANAVYVYYNNQDSGWSQAPSNGIVDPYSGIDQGCTYEWQYALHARTNTLTVGQQMMDPNTGDIIKLISLSSGSATVNIQINRTDFSPPSYSVSVPNSTDYYKGTINLQVNPTDASGIQKVLYKVDDVVVGTATSAPWSIPLDTTKYTDGTHKFYFEIYDNAAQPWGGFSDETRSPWNSYLGGNEGELTFYINNAVVNPPPPPPPKIGDCDGNGTVDLLDLSSLLGNWGTNFPKCDFDKSGSVDLLDLSSLLGNWTG